MRKAFSAFSPLPARLSGNFREVLYFQRAKMTKMSAKRPSFFFSAFFSALSPRLRVSASNGPAPAAGLSGVSSPQEHRQQSIRVLRGEWRPQVSKSSAILSLILLRAFSASSASLRKLPGSPLFSAGANGENVGQASPRFSSPLSSPRFLRVSASPRLRVEWARARR